MKKKIFIMLIIISGMFAFTACQHAIDDRYTVWTDIGTYSDFQSSFKTTLDDGMYIRLALTASEWNQISSSLTNEGKHIWTKNKIKDWFLGIGFGDSESTKESAWLTTVDHGWIASRTGNTIYYIIK